MTETPAAHSRQRKTREPCKICGLHPSLCICEFLPKLDLKTRLCLVIHSRELKRTTNTGTLALHALSNSEMRVRGENSKSGAENALDLSDLLKGPYRTLLLYPSDDAIPLSPEFLAVDSRPVQLIVPDGNWRQASKVHYRHTELKDVPRVILPASKDTIQYIRQETKPEGMATLEAIAYGLGAIEGPAIQETLLKLYKLKLENTLRGRGTFIEET